jgi:hypothetical protein
MFQYLRERSGYLKQRLRHDRWCLHGAARSESVHLVRTGASYGRQTARIRRRHTVIVELVWVFEASTGALISLVVVGSRISACGKIKHAAVAGHVRGASEGGR